MSDARFNRLVTAISVTLICLGVSYCSSKTFAPAPILKLELQEFKVIPKEPR